MCTLLVLVSCVHCTVGWVDFALFLNFMQSNVVCCSIGELPYLVLVQKQVSATPLKVHIFKKSKGQNIKIDFFGKIVFLIAHIMLEKIKSYMKNSF